MIKQLLGHCRLQVQKRLLFPVEERSIREENVRYAV